MNSINYLNQFHQYIRKNKSMRFNRLDLNLLVALDAMLTLESVTLAASKLNLSQSAMSNALARLRVHFEDELLVSAGRKLLLTPRAKTLHGAVRDVLIRIETTIAAKPEFNAATSERKFRVFVSDFTMVILMPHVLALAQVQAPGIRFDFVPQSNEPHNLLERDEADMLIFPDVYCSPEHPTEALFEEHFRCVVWNQSKLANSAHGLRGKIGAKDYSQAGHVVMQPPQGAPSFEASAIKAQGIERRIEVQTFSFVGALSLVVGSQRIATVHSRMAKYGENFLPIKSLESPVKIPAITQSMQWQKFRSNDLGLIWLRQLMGQAVLQMDSALNVASRSQPIKRPK